MLELLVLGKCGSSKAVRSPLTWRKFSSFLHFSCEISYEIPRFKGGLYVLFGFYRSNFFYVG
jgi:hypothetical protein